MRPADAAGEDFRGCFGDFFESNARLDQIEQVAAAEVFGHARPEARAVFARPVNGLDAGERHTAQDEGHHVGLDADAAGQAGEGDDAAVLGLAQDCSSG